MTGRPHGKSSWSVTPGEIRLSFLRGVLLVLSCSSTDFLPERPGLPSIHRPCVTHFKAPRTCPGVPAPRPIVPRPPRIPTLFVNNAFFSFFSQQAPGDMVRAESEPNTLGNPPFSARVR